MTGVQTCALPISPAEALLFGETSLNTGAGVWYYYSPRVYPYPYDGATHPPNRIPTPGRHNDGSNIGFGDGHAKWIATSTITSNSWSGWTAQPATLQ